jgi:hypothetical protein
MVEKCSISAEPPSDPDAAMSEPAGADTSPNEPRRRQTGQPPLLLVTENFVPQAAQVRISRRFNPSLLLGCFSGSTGFAFKA